MQLTDKPIIIITPVYEDLEASTRLLAEIGKEFGKEAFVVAVDDGSVRQPVTLDGFETANVEGEVVRLRRNVGHQRAIAIGIAYVSERVAKGQRVIVMDSDGEDTPASIKDLLKVLEDDNVDVVVAQRKSRVESLRFKAFYVIYKAVFQLLTGRKISFGNFMALRARGLPRLAAMQELSVHFAAAVLNSKLRITTCAIDRGARYAGRSKMNFIGLVLHGFRALMVFAEDVTVRVGLASISVAVLSVLGAISALVLKLVGFSTPGWFSVATGILILIFLQTGVLALMTLMLTGVVRGGTVASRLGYADFIEEVLSTTPVAEK